MSMRRATILGLALAAVVSVGCGPSVPDPSDAALHDGGHAAPIPDAGCECSSSQTGRRTQESACGDYEQTRTCDGCKWLAWQGAPGCVCTPGEVGEEREVEGGEGCMKGIKVEREVCNDEGTRYDIVLASDFDGSRVDCIAGITEERESIGECGTFKQTRSCDNNCMPGSWLGTDDSCACEYQGGSNWQECATPQGVDCGWQYCSSAGDWYPCATNPNKPARCQPGTFCAPICIAGDVKACQGETVTLPCEGDRFKRCTCQSDGRFNCSLTCFG